MGLVQVLERTPALDAVQHEQIERMASFATTRTLRRGDILWQAGDVARALTIIRNGLIKVVRPAPGDRRAICGLFGPPESVGDLPMLKGVPYPAEASVVTPTASIVQVPRELILDVSRADPHLGVSMACGMYKKMLALHDKIDVLSAGSVESRLATLLLKLYSQFGDDFDDGTSSIPVALSRRDLADLVSTSFETAIRIMRRWERDGIAETDASGFMVRNMEALNSLSGGEVESAIMTAEHIQH